MLNTTMNRNIPIWLGTLSLAALLAGGGSLSAYGSVDPSLSDLQITDAIEDELLSDPGVPLSRIDVDVQLGVATLTGVVDNALERDRATAVARTIKGVRSVVNNIEVRQAEDVTKNELAGRVLTALSENPITGLKDNSAAGLWIYKVTADTDGTVTLNGKVESWAEYQAADRIAKGVRGVTGVENNIKIEAAAHDRPDSVIAREIGDRLRWDARVDSANIVVKVDDGVVTLKGTVGSAAERAEAIYASYIDGVKRVKTGALQVHDWIDDPDRRNPVFTYQSDTEIATAIKDAFLFDPRVKVFNIDVAVDKGNATLRGKVSNLAAKRAAESDAHNTVGVVDVVNRIKVEPEKAGTDQVIADRVEAALKRDAYVDEYDFNVSVNYGVAHITGVVNTNFEKARVDTVAADVNGVIDVANDVTVRERAGVLAYNPYVEVYPDTYPYGLYNWYHVEPNRRLRKDLEIQEEINDQMFWSPFVDSDDVNVRVTNGVAKLTGTVSSWSEAQAAVDNAYEGGAAIVDNDLIIVR